MIQKSTILCYNIMNSSARGIHMEKILKSLSELRIKNFLILLLAGAINAFGVTVFLAPVKLYDSGISGTSIDPAVSNYPVVHVVVGIFADLKHSAFPLRVKETGPDLHHLLCFHRGSVFPGGMVDNRCIALSIIELSTL